MELLDWRLTVDFGMMILAHLVHWIIYPSLARMDQEQLQEWHPIYTRRITYWVLPLMFSQTAIVGLQLYFNFHWFHLIAALLIAVNFSLTFFKAVPIHERLVRSEDLASDTRELQIWDSYRTLSWSLIFVLGILEHYF